MADAPLIRVERLCKQYEVPGGEPVPVLHEVDLLIDAGELVAIMGPSGSGKSTFMNVLGCLDTPTSGYYRLQGRDVAGLSADELAALRNRLIGFVFQGFNLLSRTSALENVELPLLYMGVPRQERAKRALDALRLVGLEGREHHEPKQLSGGQQQRVAIARALVGGAPLILADEPTGNLDTKTSDEIMDLFENLNRTKGITIILVTHEPDVARYARRVVTVRDGLIVSDEPMEKGTEMEKRMEKESECA